MTCYFTSLLIFAKYTAPHLTFPNQSPQSFHFQTAEESRLRARRWWKVQCAWFCAWQYKGALGLRPMQKYVIAIVIGQVATNKSHILPIPRTKITINRQSDRREVEVKVGHSEGYRYGLLKDTRSAESTFCIYWTTN